MLLVLFCFYMHWGVNTVYPCTKMVHLPANLGESPWFDNKYFSTIFISNPVRLFAQFCALLAGNAFLYSEADVWEVVAADGRASVRHTGTGNAFLIGTVLRCHRLFCIMVGCGKKNSSG